MMAFIGNINREVKIVNQFFQQFIFIVVLVIKLFIPENVKAEVAPNTYNCAGNQIVYIGSEYSPKNDQTTFHYKISRGLLTPALDKFEFGFPNATTRERFINVDDTSKRYASIDDTIGVGKLLFTKLPITIPTTSLDLTLLGNVPTGNIPIVGQAKTNSKCINAQILGPLVVGTDLSAPNNGPTPSPTKTPTLPTCLLDGLVPELPIEGIVGQQLTKNFPLNILPAVGDLIQLDFDGWPSDIQTSHASGSILG